jgi:hypothetical protein
VAFSVHNITFTIDTGFNYDNTKLEFVAGVCRAKAAFTGQSIVVCPTLNISAWNSVAHVVMTSDENADSASARYFHDALVSFESGASTDPANAHWKTYGARGWTDAAYTDIATKGLSLAELEAVHEWPSPSYLTFAFNVHRETGSTIGNLDNVAISYSPTSAHEDLSGDFPTEPASDADLATDLAIYPEFPLALSYLTYDIMMPTPGGYHIAWRQATQMRRIIESPRFIATNATDRDAVLAFLNSHIGQASFTYDPPGVATGSKWIANEPIFHRQHHGGAWEIGCASLLEVFP